MIVQELSVTYFFPTQNLKRVDEFPKTDQDHNRQPRLYNEYH